MDITKINFLIVEDDDLQRQLIRFQLFQLGANSIRDVNNGKFALEIIKDNNNNANMDIIICDLNMPEMDGLEFLRHLGKEHQNVSIILLSALGNNLLISAGKIAKLHGIKFLGAIDKPLCQNDLARIISKYTRSDMNKILSNKNFNLTIDEILIGIEKKQFEPYFQPKVDLKTGHIIGAEALARWIHPELGLISPLYFIHDLENFKRIDDLTFLILEKAINAIKIFKAKYDDFKLSINLSPESLADTTIANKINNIVKTANLEPRNFIFEITESVAMTDIAYSLENLARLYMNGFLLSIDDYGTGFSSMQQLTRIAFSELKIDQSFIRDFDKNRELSIMVKSSIDMAHKLGMKCVAEGVETIEEWNQLKNMNCDFMQGYYISKPMNSNDFINFWKSYTPII